MLYTLVPQSSKPNIKKARLTSNGGPRSLLMDQAYTLPPMVGARVLKKSRKQLKVNLKEEVHPFQKGSYWITDNNYVQWRSAYCYTVFILLNTLVPMKCLLLTFLKRLRIRTPSHQTTICINRQGNSRHSVVFSLFCMHTI